MQESSDSYIQDNLIKEEMISLCFDDGWKSVYDNAFPVLKQNKFKATHYIISGYLDDQQFPLYK